LAISHSRGAKRKETACRVRSGAEKGNLQAAPGESRAAAFAVARFQRFRSRNHWESMQRVSGGADRCYEAAGTQFVVAIPSGRDHPGSVNHDFVIFASGCNKLKELTEMQCRSARART
jgi:hypothetical protein